MNGEHITPPYPAACVAAFEINLRRILESITASGGAEVEHLAVTLQSYGVRSVHDLVADQIHVRVRMERSIYVPGENRAVRANFTRIACLPDGLKGQFHGFSFTKPQE
jgi:hypothetical protein